METNRHGILLAAGSYTDEPIAPACGDTVIAVDGGYDEACRRGIVPGYVVGDLDSVHGALPQGTRTVVLPPEKDDPDLLSALKFGWSLGLREFDVFGATGSRIDHVISAMQLMALLAERGGAGYLHAGRQVVTAVCDGELAFAAHEPAATGCQEDVMVSVFAHSDVAAGVSEPGLKYELRDATLTNDVVQGVSNEFLPGVEGRVSVAHGTLLVTYPALVAAPRRRLFHAFDGNLGELDTRISPILATEPTERSRRQADMRGQDAAMLAFVNESH